MSRRVHINAIAFQEGDVWVVQGIEYDIVAHALDITAVTDAFMRAVAENACISEHLGRKPLEGIRPAPEQYRAMFEQATLEMRTLGPAHETRRSHPDVSVRLLDRRLAA